VLQYWITKCYDVRDDHSITSVVIPTPNHLYERRTFLIRGYKKINNIATLGKELHKLYSIYMECG
jgi:hypothetical protein